MGGAGGDDGKGGGKRRDPSGGRAYAFKALCPEALVSALIGAGGRTKDSLQNDTGCKIIAAERGEFYPGTALRIVIVYGHAPHEILPVLEHIAGSIFELCEKNPPGSESELLLGKAPGEYIFRFAIASRMSGGFIGTAGCNIQQLRTDFDVKVFVDNERYANHQMVRLIATQDALRSALARINDLVADGCEGGEDWFPEWARIREFRGEVAKGGKGGPKGGKGKSAKALPDSRGPPPPRGRSRSRSPWRGGYARNAMGDGEWWQGEEVEEHGYVGADPYAAVDIILSSAEALERRQLEEEEHKISCMMPKEIVSAMIGQGGVHVKKVKQQSGVKKIKFEEADSDAAQQNLVIEGPILGVYTAHALLMKRYHEAQQENEERERQASIEAERRAREEERRARAEEERREREREEEERREREAEAAAQAEAAAESAEGWGDHTEDVPPKSEDEYGGEEYGGEGDAAGGCAGGQVDVSRLQEQLELLKKQVADLQQSGGGKPKGKGKGKGKSKRR